MTGKTPPTLLIYILTFTLSESLLTLSETSHSTMKTSGDG